MVLVLGGRGDHHGLRLVAACSRADDGGCRPLLPGGMPAPVPTPCCAREATAPGTSPAPGLGAAPVAGHSGGGGCQGCDRVCCSGVVLVIANTLDLPPLPPSGVMQGCPTTALRPAPPSRRFRPPRA